jgi:hypothetical protein
VTHGRQGLTFTSCDDRRSRSLVDRQKVRATNGNLLTLFTICLACSGGAHDERGTAGAPTDLLGIFQDDYGIEYTITPSLWQQGTNTAYHIVHWDSADQSVVARNDDANPADGGKWTRIDWMELDDMAPYAWAYCLTVYAAESREEAEAAEPPHRATPRTGCGGFPFSRMRRTIAPVGAQ